MANSFIVYKNVKEKLLRSVGRRPLIFNNMLSMFTRRTNHSTFSENKKKLTIGNVFQDNPNAKYWLLGASTVTGGVTYYVYNNQSKKKLVLKLLPPSPSHHCFPRGEDVNKLKILLEDNREARYPKQIQISGPSGSGKTQLARLLAENLSQSRSESVEFKLWPKDEVTATLLAHSKDSLLLSLKQLAVKLGCSKDDMKVDKINVESQLDVVCQAVKNILKQNSQWVLVIDDHDISKQLAKWLPDSDWGNGYVIHTMLNGDIGAAQKSKITKYSLNQMNSDSARQLFLGIANENMREDDNLLEDPPENLLKLLLYNPLSLVCAAVYFKYQVQLNHQYSYKDLYCVLDKTVKQLNDENSDTSGLLNIQTSSITLAARVIGESSPALVHVFDLLGSCNPCHPIPFGILSCHLRTPEYHIQLTPDNDMASEGLLSNEEAASSITVTADLENEQTLWSVHGIVSQVLKMSERIKLEVEAVKSLFGYGATTLAQINPSPDGLEFVRSCPLLIRSSEQMADVEVLSSHPIVHNVLRQVFANVTIPLLEHQHLLIAERKHQQKSYFGRLQGFNPQKTISEYHSGLGDGLSSQPKEIMFHLVTGTPHIGSILGQSSSKDEDVKAKLARNQALVRHLQEHFNRVVSSFCNYYRMESSDSSGMVARALLLPHLERLLSETWLTAASKGLVFKTMAGIHCDILRDYTTCKTLLNEAYAVYKERYGDTSLEIAGILTLQAGLYSISDDLLQSKALLERASGIYEKDRKISQVCKQPLEYGKTLVALGVTCGSLGENARSKDLLEKGLMELQNASPGDPQAKENKWFGAEISSAVTNLGHAYLSLGKINQGRKLLELALIGHQNVHGDTHAEVIRTLTTLSVAHAMQGNSHESKRLRNEAGKIKKKQDMKPLLVFA